MEELIKEAKREILPLDDIIEKTWNQLRLDRTFVKNNFGEALVVFDMKATEIFRDYEKKLW